MNRKELFLKQKGEEVERLLNECCNQSGLFQERDIIKVTIALCCQPLPSPVQVSVSLPYEKRKKGRGVQYRYSCELTEDDWKQIFIFSWPEKHKKVLTLIKESGNRGVRTEEFKQHGLYPSGEGLINKRFREQGLRFTVRHPEALERGNLLYGTLVVLKILGTK